MAAMVAAAAMAAMAAAIAGNFQQSASATTSSGTCLSNQNPAVDPSIAGFFNLQPYSCPGTAGLSSG
jgi:hypothetical protein